LVFTVDFKGFGYLISWRGSEAVNHGHACKRSGNWEGFAIPSMPCRGSEAVNHGRACNFLIVDEPLSICTVI